MNKQLIIVAVRELLESARSRGTDQGVLVYTNVLQMLERATNQNEIDDIKSKLDQALCGIEAHGSFTDSEFSIVRRLRN